MTYQYYSAPMGYDGIVATQGDIIKEYIIGEWQGDYVYLLKNGERFGFTVIGYGSCSGCDVLQGCENDEEFNKLKQDVIRGIFWGTAEEVRDYITNNNANRWYFTEHDWKTVRRELKAELRKG